MGGSVGTLRQPIRVYILSLPVIGRCPTYVNI